MLDRTRTPAFSGANHQSVSRSNRSVIFRALHALAPISRIELARESGLNPGTVTNIVEELIASGLVREIERSLANKDEAKRLGRRRILLEVNPGARYAIGIDLARNTISGAIVDLAGEIVVHATEPTGELVSHNAIRQILAIVDQLLSQFPTGQHERVVGIGIGAPGALSIRSGIFLPPPSYGSWEGIDLREEIRSATNLATTIDNNANTCTLAELWFGAGVGVDNFVLLNLGTGVGAGLVLDGDLYRGQHDLAAEIGHVSIAMDGARCACGNYGCLEMFVSVPRVLAAAYAAMQTGEPTILRSSVTASSELTLDLFLAAVEAGDSLASRILNDAARYLAAGIVNIINTLDPDIVFVGREMARAGDTLLEPVRAEVKRRVLPILRPTVRIDASILPDAPVIGAAVLALQKFFDAPLAQ